MECCSEKLDGDADVLGDGRMGPVYRKMLGSYDVCLKLLAFCCKRGELDGERNVLPTTLREEMRNEVQVYQHLHKLQGLVVPRLLWYGELVPGMADAIATEYSGGAFPYKPSADQKQGAIDALDMLHQNGILHGDVELKNFVCQGSKVFILDFGFSEWKDDMDDDAAWKARVAEEKLMLKKELGLFTSRKRRLNN